LYGYTYTVRRRLGIHSAVWRCQVRSYPGSANTNDGLFTLGPAHNYFADEDKLKALVIKAPIKNRALPTKEGSKDIISRYVAGDNQHLLGNLPSIQSLTSGIARTRRGVGVVLDHAKDHMWE
jgi:hypothetical protein